MDLETGSVKGSGRSVLVARHDGDDNDDKETEFKGKCFVPRSKSFFLIHDKTFSSMDIETI